MPKKYFDVDFDIAEKYKEEADSFLKLFKLIDGNEFKKEKQEKIKQAMEKVLKVVEKNFESISNIFKYHNSANPKGHKRN